MPQFVPRANEQLGPYTLIRQLGRGAFGVVWLAERRSALVVTQVALKLVLDDEPNLNEISQESRLWGQAAGHPNVLSIIEADVYDGQVVIASEYAPDGSLKEWLDRHGKAAPSLDAAVKMMHGILAGLAHLHEKKIVHRDLKPANILLHGETPRLADFGLARVLKSSANSGSVAGTPSYMAPENFDGKRSQQSDIWAAGVIFYQMLAGRLPFPQTDFAALIGALVHRNAEPLPPAVPLPLREFVARALQKDPARRYQSAMEMLTALDLAAGMLGTLSLHAATVPMINPIANVALPLEASAATAIMGTTQDAGARRSTSTVINPITQGGLNNTTELDSSHPHGRRPMMIISAALLLALTLGAYAFFFRAAETSSAAQPVAAVERKTGAAARSDNSSIDPAEQAAWDKIRSSDNARDFNDFLKNYPASTFAQSARDNLARLHAPEKSAGNNGAFNSSVSTLPATGERSGESGGSIRSGNAVADLPRFYDARSGGDRYNQQTQQRAATSTVAVSTSSKYNGGPLNISGNWEESNCYCTGSRLQISQRGSEISVSGQHNCQGGERGGWQGTEVNWRDNTLSFKMPFMSQLMFVEVQFSSENEGVKIYHKGDGHIGKCSIRKISN